jgi:heterodisulfide reductase subunit A
LKCETGQERKPVLGDGMFNNDKGPANKGLDRAKIGAVMIVGGGVSGIQAALDLANSGFKVFLVDKEASIGGKMAQLDKTFPTNDCSMCILSPKLIECSINPNITILTDAEIVQVEGEAGDFKVTLTQKPRYVDPETCTGCGTCAEYCPVYIPDPYNENLGKVKCIHMSFAQAVPAVSTVSPGHCLFVLREVCQICRQSCKNKAIDFKQQERRFTIEVGSLILAPGYDIFDPNVQSQYGYGRFSNVVTSLEFERMISASGPNGGELVRPSDGMAPKRIAWIQCVGSRDKCAGNTYCSAVCCMYAIKHVILSKDHDPDMEAVIFHNDIRAYGKGFDRYYERAKAMDGVRFIWSKVAVVGELPETENIVLRYRVNGSEIRDEEFDLIVLSVGLMSKDRSRQLAEDLSIAVNADGFSVSPGLSPVETTRAGIYACGVFHAPMDIPDSVTMASAAAALSTQLLSDERGTLVSERHYPSERHVAGEPPRLGVFVCRCGTNIAKGVNVTEVVEYVKGLEGVIHAEEGMFSCSVDSVSQMVRMIREKSLNRVVVAACTPRTHQALFQDALKEAGLNPFLFEFANIREQCSLVHQGEKERATEKAQDLVRMAVSKARLLEPLHRISYSVNNAGLVIGGGVAGMACALALAEQGYRVHLVEKSKELGGNARRIHFTLDERDVQGYLHELISQVNKHPLIKVYKEANILNFKGFVGNFVSTISVGAGGRTEEIEHGVAVVASGAEQYTPTEYLYGKHSQVVSAMELEEALWTNSRQLEGCKSIVMIQCVGSREEERQYCSRVCCSQAIKNALKLKEMDPDRDVFVLYRDMRTYAFREDYYRKAAEQGVKFVRYEADDKPDVNIAYGDGQEVVRVTVRDLTLGQHLVLDADLLVLGAAIVPNEANRGLSQLLKVPLNEDGFFMEAHMKLRPVDFASDGIFMCGMAHNPKFIEESIAQAHAAASRATTILNKKALEGEATIAEVNEVRCGACGICEITCPYGAIKLDLEKGSAAVNVAVCKGCGSCAAACPSSAIESKYFTSQQILKEIEAATWRDPRIAA